MALRVWIIRRKIPGKRKHKYRLRWEEPIRDDTGHLVLEDEGQPKLRQRQQTLQSTDKLTVDAEWEKKYREINGLLREAEEGDDEEAPVVVLSDLIEMDEQWLRNRNRSESTIYLTKLTFTRFIKLNGNLPVSAVGPKEIERFITARRQKVKARPVNRELTELRATFGRAVDAFQLIEKNPFAKVKKLTVAEREIRVITHGEEGELLKACGDDLELELFLRLAFDTGARCGEIAHLLWSNLDLEQRVGEIRCTAVWKSKTRRNRPTAWTSETNAKLRQWRLLRLGKPYVFMEEDGPARQFYYYLNKKFRQALMEAKIPKCTLHDIRRTVGTRLAEAGVNEAVAAAYLGHTDISTTVKFYQRIRKEVLKDTVDRLRGTGTF